jgi:hypothetical protein
VDDFYFAEALVDVLKLDTCHYGNSFSLWATGIQLFLLHLKTIELSLDARIATEMSWESVNAAS